MTDQPPQLLSYATPSEQVMPGFVMFVSITGICIGTLSCLVDFATLSRIAIRFAFNFNLIFNVFRAYQLISAIVFVVLAGALVAASIGCLRRRERARVWIVRYAVVYLIALGADLLARPVIQIMPGLLRFGAVADPGISRYVFFSVERSAVSALFTGALPMVILLYMRRPTVRAGFAGAL